MCLLLEWVGTPISCFVVCYFWNVEMFGWKPRILLGTSVLNKIFGMFFLIWFQGVGVSPNKENFVEVYEDENNGVISYGLRWWKNWQRNSWLLSSLHFQFNFSLVLHGFQFSESICETSPSFYSWNWISVFLYNDFFYRKKIVFIHFFIIFFSTIIEIKSEGKCVGNLTWCTNILFFFVWPKNDKLKNCQKVKLFYINK